MKSRLISNRFKYVRPTRAFSLSTRCHTTFRTYRFACFNKFQIVKKFVWIRLYICVWSPRRKLKKKFVILSGDCDYFNYNNMHFVVVVAVLVFFFNFFLFCYYTARWVWRISGTWSIIKWSDLVNVKKHVFRSEIHLVRNYCFICIFNVYVNVKCGFLFFWRMRYKFRRFTTFIESPHTYLIYNI